MAFVSEPGRDSACTTTDTLTSQGLDRRDYHPSVDSPTATSTSTADGDGYAHCVFQTTHTNTMMNFNFNKANKDLKYVQGFENPRCSPLVA